MIFVVLIHTVNPLNTNTQYDKIRYTHNLIFTKLYLKTVYQKSGFNTSRNVCFGYWIEFPHWGSSNKHLKHMFYKEIRIKPFLTYHSGPTCSKLTMFLVNVLLKFWSWNMAYMLIFLLKKMWVAFAFAKATHIFSAKIVVDLILYLLEQLTFWPLMSSLS